MYTIGRRLMRGWIAIIWLQLQTTASAGLRDPVEVFDERAGRVSMRTDKIRYLVFLKGRWRWSPTKSMRNAGFRLINLSPGLLVDGCREPSMEDKKEALRLNEDWDRYRSRRPRRPRLRRPHTQREVSATATCGSKPCARRCANPRA
jgi:hypothetical protein